MNHEARDKAAVKHANKIAKFIPESVPIQYRSAQKAAAVSGYLAGHAAAQKEFEESLRVAGKAIQNAVDLFDTTNPLCADEITNLEKALAHLVKAGHYQLPCNLTNGFPRRTQFG